MNTNTPNQGTAAPETESKVSGSRRTLLVTGTFVLVAFVLAAIIMWAVAVKKGGHEIPPQTSPEESLSENDPFTADLANDASPRPEVALLQVFLAGQKYFDEEPDGVFDAGVANALIAFQKDQGVAASGILDQATRELLNMFFKATPGYFADDRSFSGIGIGQCKGFALTNPTPGETVVSPFTISGSLHPYKNTGIWNAAGSNAGTVVVQSTGGEKISEPVPLTLASEYQRGVTNAFSATVTLPRTRSSGPIVDLFFQDIDGTHQCYLSVRVPY